MIALTLYHKSGCHLCEQAEELLDPWLASGECGLERVNILEDPALFEEYRYRIPVIVRHDTRQSLEGRVTLPMIEALFTT